ncbi:SusD/RagB family nutrient-binding outer membrane lipoprotein [Joostella sp. CR20]|uniref:SusD/RagB family nutrient-binding outer membrane lipoprotein n=1 Tax=Joostella sp. CR20 TaxID=2804312 RepID=UPI00313D1C61
MKKIALTIISLVTLISCQSDDKYENYNRDPKNPTQVDSDFLFNNAQKSLVDQMTSTNVNLNVFRLLGQHWTETTYIDEANYDLTNRNIPQSHWSEMYRDVLLDLETAKEVAEANVELSAAEKAARVAQAEVLMVYTYQQLVDTYGNIPYTEALDAEQFPLPAYDDAATIYSDLITRIDAAIPNLTGTGFGIDNLYGGNMAAWKKFANSVKLRLGIRLTDVNATLAQSTVESAVAAGVFTSNSDNAVYEYQGATPNTNPLWVDLVQSGRSDFVPANTLVDFMNDLEDPRRAVYFDSNMGEDTYVGGIYGDSNTFSNFTHIGPSLHEPTFPGVLLDFSEVSFYLAEAAARSYSVTGTVEENYNNGITASFEYWGVDGVDEYLAKPEVAYATATGADWKEKIGNQFWLAMYNRGFEAWTVWRKYDTPTFNLPADTGNPVPTRYTYPINELTLNGTSWEAAAEAIGGDEQTTKLFWDTTDAPVNE